jgi:cytochrome b6-f complex iron-sulfur subunit
MRLFRQAAARLGWPETAENRPARRVDRIVRDLLTGRRLGIEPKDAADRDAIMTAAQLAGSREGFPSMDPRFRERLAAQLKSAGGELSGAGSPGKLTRRQALLVAASGIAAGLVGAGAVGVADRRALGGMATSRPVKPSPGRWVDVAALTDLPEGQGVRVIAGAVGAYLFRSGDRVAAVSSICSDLPCELAWDAGKGLLTCPCHLKGFTPAGRSTSPTWSHPPLSRVVVRVDGGRVLIWGT